ncbi:DNA-binding transcription factor yap1, partial [Lobosporangium transversale]
DGHSPGEGKPAPKKAGRKPLTTEPTNKRKAQNRAAQRAFRDRKERYVKSLEERIKELEELNPGKTDAKLAEENMNLKLMVQKLETENYFLKEQAFTFDFPISQPGLYNVAKLSHDGLLQPNTNSSQNAQSSQSPKHSVLSPTSQTLDSASSSSNTATPPTPAQNKSFAASNVAKPPTYDQLPWSPPSSVGDSVPNSPLDSDLSTPEQDTVNQSTPTDNAGVVPRFRNSSPEEAALFSQILDGTGNTAPINSIISSATTTATTTIPVTSQQLLQPSQTTFNQMNQYVPFGPTTTSTAVNLSSASPLSTLAGLSEHSSSPSMDELVNTPLFDANLQFTPTTSGLSVAPFTFDQTQALFTDFRDPSDPRDFFTFEDPVEASFHDDKLGGLFSDQLLDYTNAFANVAATSTTTPLTKEDGCEEFSGKDGNKHVLPPLGENEKAYPCPQAWEQLAKHPNFDDVDIDELCAELKSKAKCSGHGPMIAHADVEKLMNRLDQQ